MTQYIEPNRKSDLTQATVRAWLSPMASGVLEGFDVTPGSSGFLVNIASGRLVNRGTVIHDDLTRVNDTLVNRTAGQNEHHVIYATYTPAETFPPPSMVIGAVKASAAPPSRPVSPNMPADSVKLADIFISSTAVTWGAGTQIIVTPKLSARGLDMTQTEVAVDRLLQANANVIVAGGGGFNYSNPTLTWDQTIVVSSPTVTARESFFTAPIARVNIAAGSLGGVGPNSLLFIVFDRRVPGSVTSQVLRVLDLDNPDPVQRDLFFNPTTRDQIVIVGTLTSGVLSLRGGAGMIVPPAASEPPPKVLHNVPGGQPVWAPVDDTDVVGGMRVVADVAARSAIPGAQKKIGMIAYTQSDGATSVLTALPDTWSPLLSSAGVIDDSVVVGGLKALAPGQGLSSIPVGRQKIGMLVWHADDGRYYRISSTGATPVAGRFVVGDGLDIISNSSTFAGHRTSVVGGAYSTYCSSGTSDVIGMIGSDGGGIMGLPAVPGAPGSSGTNFGIRADNRLLLMAGAALKMEIDTAGNVTHYSTQYNARPGAGTAYEFVHRDGGSLEFYTSGSQKLLTLFQTGEVRIGKSGSPTNFQGSAAGPAGVWTLSETGVITGEALNVGVGAINGGSISVGSGSINGGAATVTSVNRVAITAPATSATLTIANGKTFTANNSVTLSGTDGSSVALGGGGTVAYTANKISDLSACTSAELAGKITDETGSGALVFAASPTLSSPTMSGTINIGSAASTVGIEGAVSITGTANGTLNLFNQAVSSGTTTINIGSGGHTGGTKNINIGNDPDGNISGGPVNINIASVGGSADAATINVGVNSGDALNLRCATYDRTSNGFLCQPEAADDFVGQISNVTTPEFATAMAAGNAPPRKLINNRSQHAINVDLATNRVASIPLLIYMNNASTFNYGSGVGLVHVNGFLYNGDDVGGHFGYVISFAWNGFTKTTSTVSVVFNQFANYEHALRSITGPSPTPPTANPVLSLSNPWAVVINNDDIGVTLDMNFRDEDNWSSNTDIILHCMVDHTYMMP